ncbi:hypothetical protein AwErysi_09130 [Erysipelotrichaceae bacterium]|nr:hypothetical protein AwErysi_09130 [Erysipelotrichaceae bacterium]
MYPIIILDLKKNGVIMLEPPYNAQREVAMLANGGGFFTQERGYTKKNNFIYLNDAKKI